MSVGCESQADELLTQPSDAQSQTKCKHCRITVNGVLGTSRMCQTDPLVESRGVNTKLRKEQRGHKPDQCTPTPECKIECQWGNKLSTVTEVVPLTQITTLPVSQQNLEEDNQQQCEDITTKPLSTVYKIPQNVRHLLTFMLIKLNNMKNRYRKSDIYKESAFCPMCNETDHALLSCRSMKRFREGVTQWPSKCFICDEFYHTTTFGWIEVLETVDKLSVEQQKELLIGCPFLDSVCDTEMRSLVNIFSWERMSQKVQDAGSKTFEFPYIKTKVEKLPS